MCFSNIGFIIQVWERNKTIGYRQRKETVMIGCHVESVCRVNFQFFVPEKGAVTWTTEHGVICSAGQGCRLPLWGKFHGLPFTLILFDLLVPLRLMNSSWTPLFLWLCLLHTHLNSSDSQFSVPSTSCSLCSHHALLLSLNLMDTFCGFFHSSLHSFLF